MTIALALVLTIVLQGQPVAPRGPDEQPLAEQLWYEHPFSRGEMSCDRALRRAQERRFDRKFQARIVRLKRAYEIVNGPDGPIEVIASMSCTRGAGASAMRAFAKGLRHYETFLHEAERRWGVIPGK